MKTPRDIDALLPDNSVDAGCAAGFELLHQYVDDELSGGDPATSQPGLAAHISSCPACREDYRGLRDAAALFGDAEPLPS
jgi:anti-sigma factor RsiW